MRYASIDVGTNTLRLLIAELGDKGFLTPIVYKRVITRLGGGYTAEKGIDRFSAERTLKTLEGFKKDINGHDVENILAVGTSVIRRAKNKIWFLDEVYKRTGIKVEAIDGNLEARLSLAGVLSVVGMDKKDRIVVDIGGGSTEFIACRGEEILGTWSMDMGVVHMSERHLKSDPPKAKELESMTEEIKGVMKNLKEFIRKEGATPLRYSEKNGAEFVGTAGTVTTLASLDQDITVYDRNLINNYILKRFRIKAIYDNLVSLTLKEREKILTLEKGREDIIIPGAAIVLEIMGSFGFSSMRVSDSGLLEGIIIKGLRENDYKKGGLGEV